MTENDITAADSDLLPLVYGELRALADRLMAAERGDHTLQPTALVHEVWLRLTDQPDGRWSDRQHFVAVAARAMRRVLCDYARRTRREKRGGDRLRMTLSELTTAAAGTDVTALDRALDRLAEQDEQLARIVELRFFGGMKHPDIARTLGLSLRSVERSWALARAWLARELEAGPSSP